MGHIRVPELLAGSCVGCCFTDGSGPDSPKCENQCHAGEKFISLVRHIMIEGTPEAVAHYARLRLGVGVNDDA